MKVLITRPKKAADSLASELAANGITGICFPSIDIIPLAVVGEFSSSLQKSSIVIFVSASAVEQFFVAANQTALENKIVLAIGQATARALEQRHVGVNGFPGIANSENLLAFASLQNVAEQHIIIFAGLNGREELQTTLKRRGANVEMIYLYERGVPQYTLPLPWQLDEIDLSVCTSGQCLANFNQLIHLHELQGLYQKPLIVITEAMRDQARQLGFKSAIIRAEGAANVDVLNAIQQRC